MSVYSESDAFATPRWMGDTGVAYRRGAGAERDRLVDRWKQVLRQFTPGFCSPDALAYHGDSSGLPRVQSLGAGDTRSETDSAYRKRIVARWKSWGGDLSAIVGQPPPWYGGAGSPAQLLSELVDEGYAQTTPSIVTAQGMRFYVDATGLFQYTAMAVPWFFGPYASWNYFQLVFFPPFPAWWTFAGPPAAEVNVIRTLVGQWKPAHWICAGLTFFNGIGGPAGSVPGELWGYPGVDWPPGNPGIWDDPPNTPPGDPATWTGNSSTYPGIA